MTLGEGLGLFATLMTIIVAVYGLDAWRREHTGRRQIELAEDALAKFYEAKDALIAVRHPASSGDETRDVVQQDGETSAQYEARKSASVVFARFARYSELFNQIHAMRYRFMAQIGKDEAKPFDDLHAVVNDVQRAAMMLGRLWARDMFRDDVAFEANRKMINDYEAIFWWGLPEDDVINPRVDKLLKEMETICRKVIAGKGTLHGFLNKRLG